MIEIESNGTIYELPSSESNIYIRGLIVYKKSVPKMDSGWLLDVRD
jgi:hypothetical protein